MPAGDPHDDHDDYDDHDRHNLILMVIMIHDHNDVHDDHHDWHNLIWNLILKMTMFLFVMMLTVLSYGDVDNDVLIYDDCQGCRLEQGKPVCFCHEGFTFIQVRRSYSQFFHFSIHNHHRRVYHRSEKDCHNFQGICEDIDECLDDNGGCSQVTYSIFMILQKKTLSLISVPENHQCKKVTEKT